MLASKLSLLWIFSAVSLFAADQEVKLLLILSLGRSGTVYITDIFKSAGIELGHERLGKDGAVAWPFEVDFPGSHLGYDYEHIFHQVRNPLSVISSWCYCFKNLSSDLWSRIRYETQEINRDDSLLVHCAKYYYFWNLRSEKLADWRYRIEDFDFLIPEFERRLEMRFNRDALSQISKMRNHCGDIVPEITWADLKSELPQELFIDLQEMARRYGYPCIEKGKHKGTKNRCTPI
jgi:hypothetical protein